MTRLKSLTIMTALVILFASAGRSQEKSIAMTPVKYDGLKQEVLKQRGKVVLVDFWGSFCKPCKEKMPHVVELQRKLADQGLVVISVSIDTPGNDASIAAANKFLQKINSPFVNLFLDEEPEVWQKKLDFQSVPCYYVFDRRGKWVRFRPSDYKDDVINFADVETTITRLLAEK